jgi:hypothetical protein
MWAGRGWGRGRCGQGKDVWMDAGGGRGGRAAAEGRGPWRLSRRSDRFSAATPLQSILQKHTETAVVLIPVVNRQFGILQQE